MAVVNLLQCVLHNVLKFVINFCINTSKNPKADGTDFYA